MANHHAGHWTVHHQIDTLSWPVATTSVLVWPVWSWAAWLWTNAPTPTAIYMGVSLLFMLFQMADKLGFLERFKRRPSVEEIKEELAELELKARELQNQNLADVAHGAVARVQQVLSHPDLGLVKPASKVKKEQST